MPSEIRHVQFTPADFLADADFQGWGPALRGAYCTILFFMYCNGGKIRDDAEYVRGLCNWIGDGWEDAYKTVRGKFRVRTPNLHHKRVTKELRRAEGYRQAKRTAGLAGAKARWGGNGKANSIANGNAMAKEREGKEREAPPPTPQGGSGGGAEILKAMKVKQDIPGVSAAAVLDAWWEAKQDKAVRCISAVVAASLYGTSVVVGTLDPEAVVAAHKAGLVSWICDGDTRQSLAGCAWNTKGLLLGSKENAKHLTPAQLARCDYGRTK